MDLIDLFRGMVGILILIGIAYILSNNKRSINWRLVGWGIGLQILFAVLILKGESLGNLFFLLGWPKIFFKWVSSFFVLVLNFTTEGAVFIFGDLAISPGNEGSLLFAWFWFSRSSQNIPKSMFT